MPRGYIETKRIAKQEIRYRYKCEYCQTITEWYDSSIIQKANKIYRFKRNKKIDDLNIYNFDNDDKNSLTHPKLDEQLDKKAKQRIKIIINKLNDSLYNSNSVLNFPDEPFIASIFNETFVKGKSCPNCGKRQSWYPALSTTFSNKQSVIQFSIGFAVTGVILTSLAIGITATTLSFLFYLSIVFIGALIIGGIFGLLFSLYNKNKYLKTNNNTKISNILEVDWNRIIK